MSLVARVLFYPSLAYTVIMSKCTARKWYNRVDETVLIGALPLKHISKQLIEQENVKAVLSMNENYELKLATSAEDWKSLGVDHLQLSTVDFVGIPTLNKLHRGVQFILSHRDKNDTVYVHCKAGRSRSAMVVLCYLIKVHHWDPVKAYTFLKQCRPHVWVRDAQMEEVWKFYNETVQ